MANAKIDIVGPGELQLIADIYNGIFKPAHDIAFFKRRFLGRYNTLELLASVDGNPAGFALGFELKPTVFFAWLFGVGADFRRAGVGSQLMDAIHGWAKEHGYEVVRLECQNGHRAMMQMCLTHGFDVVGVRWDGDRGENLVIFEKSLHD